MAPSPNRITSPWRRSLALVGLGLLPLLATTGCGKDDKAASASCRTLTPDAKGEYRTTIVAKNLQFDVRCIDMGPGTLHITYDNQDSGVAHDLRITGQGVNESTDLERGPVGQELVVELTTLGTYTYACDPHATMEGVITVAEPKAPGDTETPTS